jgi:hypothetical protein
LFLLLLDIALDDGIEAAEMTMNAARTPYNDSRRLRRSPGVLSGIHPEQHFPANEAYISNVS